MKQQMVSMPEEKLALLDLLRLDKSLKYMGYLRNFQLEEMFINVYFSYSKVTRCNLSRTVNTFHFTD